jgi:hypothetical protein
MRKTKGPKTPASTDRESERSAPLRRAQQKSYSPEELMETDERIEGAYAVLDQFDRAKQECQNTENIAAKSVSASLIRSRRIGLQ